MSELATPAEPITRTLLIAALATGVKVLSEGRVLVGVTTHADPQSYPATGQHVELDHLLGQQRRGS